MPREFRRFLFRASIFAIPFALHAMTTIVVDPFDRIGVSHLVSDEVKLRTSFILNWVLWKLVKYEQAPMDRILLGDSRMELLTPAILEAQGISGFANLAYGGGALQEAIDSFWLASKRTRLKQVVIGLNLFNYNGSAQQYNRVPESDEVANNPILYLYDRTVLRALGYNLLALKDPTLVLDRKPPMSKEEFWRYQLDVSAMSLYADYTYPTAAHSNLVSLANYCRENGIRIHFVIIPTHVELQEMIARLGLEAANARFKSDLRALAPVVDLDGLSELTSDRDNFDDPFHVTRKTAASLARTLVSYPFPK